MYLTVGPELQLVQLSETGPSLPVPSRISANPRLNEAHFFASQIVAPSFLTWGTTVFTVLSIDVLAITR